MRVLICLQFQRELQQHFYYITLHDFIVSQPGEHLPSPPLLTAISLKQVEEHFRNTNGYL